jgi:hypothetical protein
MPQPIPRRNARLALALALAVDFLQLALIPLFAQGAFSPIDVALDMVTAVVMCSLLRWHLAFLPSFLGELIPFVNLVPTWTAAVVWVTREPPPGPGGKYPPEEEPPPTIRTVENLANRDRPALPPAGQRKGNRP